MHGTLVCGFGPAPRRAWRRWRRAAHLAGLLFGLGLLQASTAHALSTRTLFSPKGEKATSRLGNVVAKAGDVNGDGFADVIAGAFGYDVGGSTTENTGRAYLYLGGPDADDVPDLVLTGDAVGDQFGFTVSGAGDVNGDGFADIMVSSPFSDAGGPDAGRVTLYFGSAEPEPQPAVTLTGLAANDWFGYWTAAAGDVNADGYDDVIIGAPQVASVGNGQAYVFYGGASMNATADLTLPGGGAGDQYGASVGGAGDVNGDGFADFVVGATHTDAAGDTSGRAYLYYGGPSVNTTADLVLTGEATGDQFGFNVSGGDVNGDGYSDVLVSAWMHGFDNSGRVYAFFGGSAPDAVADLTLSGELPGDHFGSQVASGGDVNGDGYADLTVSAHLGDKRAPDAGRAYVYLGGPGLDANPELTLSGELNGDNYGSTFVIAGDVDGRGYDDLVVGAWQNDAGGNNAGRFYVYAVYSYEIVLPTGGDQWRTGAQVTVMWHGHEVADIELSTDGGLSYTKVVRGVGGSAFNTHHFFAPETPTHAARIRIIEQGADPTRALVDQSGKFSILHQQASRPMSNETAVAWSPSTAADTVDVSRVCDVNGDGNEDAIMAMSGSGGGAGRVDIYLGTGRTATGRPKLGSTPISLLGGAGESFGASVTVGDVNGDCKDDIAVGAPNALSAAGRVRVYFGGDPPDVTADWTINGTNPGDRLGSAVALVDMNGDGYDDLAAGAPLADANGSNSGSVQLYFGGSAPDAASDLTLNGEATEDQFGSTLMPLPDGDGIDWCERFPILCPVISGVLGVGSPFNDLGGLDAGAAYLFAGGFALDATPDETMRGSQAGAHFGASMASIGDFSGDGLPDFAVGAPDEDGFGPLGVVPNVGRVRVWTFDPRCFVINPWPPSPGPWFVVDGEAANDRFGLRLAGTDVDHNGLSDLIVSAPFHDRGGQDAGCVYGFSGRVAPAEGVDPLWLPAVQGVNPHFIIADGAAGDRVGWVLGATPAIHAEPDPEPAGRSHTTLRRRIVCRRTTLQSSPALAHRPASGTGHPRPEPPTLPMQGGDLLVGRRGTLPQFRLYDANRFHLKSPVSTATWNVGSLQTVSWTGSAPAVVELSVDGGHSFNAITTSPGGSKINSVGIRVPHLPTKFGLIRIGPWDPCELDPTGLTCPPIWGFAQSDTFLTIQSSVALLQFTAQRRDEGAVLAWSTEPAVGPEGLAGYRLYRVGSGTKGEGTRIGPELIAEATYLDREATAGDEYRLTSINGLGEELELGRISTEPERLELLAWPSPVRHRGVVTVTLPALQQAAGLAVADLDVGVFDIGGRRVATLASGTPKEPGAMRLEWRTSASGEPVRPGLYFVRASAPSARLRLERKVVVMP